jgi:hypothetical protein
MVKNATKIQVHDFLGDLVMSFGVATVLYLFVEAPLFEITRLIFAKGWYPGSCKFMSINSF